MRHSFQTFLHQEELDDAKMAALRDILGQDFDFSEGPFDGPIDGDFGFWDVSENEDWNAFDVGQVPGFEQDLEDAGLKKEDLKRVLGMEFRGYQDNDEGIGKEWRKDFELDKLKKLKDRFGQDPKVGDKEFSQFEDWKAAAGNGEIKKLFQDKIVPNLSLIHI